jgi:hypothetical protein
LQVHSMRDGLGLSRRTVCRERGERCRGR